MVKPATVRIRIFVKLEKSPPSPDLVRQAAIPLRQPMASTAARAVGIETRAGIR
jgi:hypothetical protein